MSLTQQRLQTWLFGTKLVWPARSVEVKKGDPDWQRDLKNKTFKSSTWYKESNTGRGAEPILYTHTHTHTDTRSDTPLSKQTATHWLTDQRFPAAWSSEPALWMCAVPWTWWEGEKFPQKTRLDHWETMPSSSCPVSQAALWICWFLNYFLQVIQRDWGEILSQRMLPQVIRILYVLSFCFFQGCFIRWGAPAFIILRVFVRTAWR